MVIADKSRAILTVLGLVALATLSGHLGWAVAEPIDVRSGTVVLPVSGLEVDLPATAC